MLNLDMKPVGSWQANSYLVTDPESGMGVLVDPGDQAQDLLAWVGDNKITHILLTHGDPDHVGALKAVRDALQVPAGIHPADAAHFSLPLDFDLQEGQVIPVGEAGLQVVHLPGHTPGSVGFQLVERGKVNRVLVGDAIFPGGPGRTRSPDDLQTALEALARTVFTWPDEVHLYPGHGQATTVGAERAAFEAFTSRPLPADLYGDITWR